MILMAVIIGGCKQSTAPAQSNPAPSARYAAVARGKIDVEGGLLNLGMPIDGTLSEVDVHESDRVTRGQVLAVIDSTEARVALELAQAKLDKSSIQPRLLAERLNSARKRSQRLSAAAQAGAGDGQSADDAAETLRQIEADLQDAQATTRIAVAEVEQARHALDRHTLRAPLAAEVVHVAAQPGATVSSQSSALFTLLPVQSRIVRAELTQTFVASVHIGMTAQIVTDDDAQTPVSNARVLRIGTIYGPSTIDDSAEAHVGERSVECVLTLDDAAALRIGQRVLVRFLPAKG